MAKKTKELAIVQDPKFVEIVKDSQIELTKAQNHALAFSPLMIKYHELAASLSSMDKNNPTKDNSSTARTNRLLMVKIRTSAGEIKDQRKESIKIEDALIMSLHNTVINTCKLTEAEFEAIEKHGEIQEKLRLDKVEVDRTELLLPYGEVSKFMDIRNMDDDTFTEYLSSQKILFDAKAKAAAQKVIDYKKAQDAEDLRLKNLQATAEENRKKEKLYTERLGLCLGAGLVILEADLIYSEKVIFTLDDLKTLSVKDFSKSIAEISKLITKEEGIKAANQKVIDDKLAEDNAAAQRIIAGQYQSRCNLARATLLNLGFVDYPKNEFMKHETFGFCISYDNYNALENDDLLEIFISDNTKIVNEAIDKEKAAIARRNELAPDKEKIKEFAIKFKQLESEFPEMKTKAGQLAKDIIVDALGMIKTIVNDQYSKLK